jgi:vancomycin resistance protein YoaR
MVTSWIGIVGGLSAGALLGAIGWIAFVPETPPLLLIEGYEYRIPDGGEGSRAERAIAEAIDLRTNQLLSREVSLRADEEVAVASARELGYRVDRAAALQDAKRGVADAHVSWKENVGVWLLRRFSDEPETHALSLTLKLDQQVSERTLTFLAANIDREAQDAQMLISEHKIIPSREGRRLSIAGTIVRMESGTFEDVALVDASIERIPPRVSEDDLAPVDVTRVLAQYETSFRGKAGARAVNIRRAGKYLDGAILLPGEELRFNDVVGRRIHGRGFVDAPVIINDEMERDVGGGVCQVATTLHAAAVYANLEIVQRRSHSRPSGYAPLGLDATVIDGKVDLKMRNPYDEPLLVHVSFPSQYVIRVEMLGRDPNAKVEHAYSVTHREPFARRIWHREEAPLGGFEQKQKGSEGMDVVSVLRIKLEDGTMARRSYHSKYYPVPEVFWVGRGASHSELPAMPDKAAALVVDGEEIEGGAGKGSGKKPPSNEDVPSLSEADGSNRAAPTARELPRDLN